MTAASHLCRCPRPARMVDRDGVAYCDSCGELLHDGRDELIAALVKKVDALSRRLDEVVPLQAAPQAEPRLTAKEKALELSVSVDYVYRHREALGGRRLPSPGGQGRLRFPIGDSAPPSVPSSPRPRRARTAVSRGELLPIKGARR